MIQSMASCTRKGSAVIKKKKQFIHCTTRQPHKTDAVQQGSNSNSNYNATPADQYTRRQQSTSTTHQRAKPVKMRNWKHQHPRRTLVYFSACSFTNERPRSHTTRVFTGSFTLYEATIIHKYSTQHSDSAALALTYATIMPNTCCCLKASSFSSKWMLGNRAVFIYTQWTRLTHL